MTHISIIGAGHFGSVLGEILSAQHQVKIYKRGNSMDVKKTDLLLFALPVLAYDEVLHILQNNHDQLPTVVVCSKGIDKNSRLPHDIILHHFSKTKIAVLAGPNFAHELQKKLPTASVIASHDNATADFTQNILQQPFWRIYKSNDPIGISLNGAIKNTLAIASGIAMGKKLGDNARSSLITRGLYEMRKFLIAKKNKEDNSINPDSCYGLSGLGDLILTASSALSRNTNLGIQIAENPDRPVADIVAEQKNRGIAEGYYTADILLKMAEKLEINLPIINMVANILYHDFSVDDAIKQLLLRPIPDQETTL